ncbi:MAG: hypothetical protein GC136_10325 [Alphaproteobacteria bacterium]|nr:hypothetical protein [Alphaproteobacteria bacterium]
MYLPSESQKILEILGGYKKSNAHMPETMFVGGSVRDLLLGKIVLDWDIATIHTPDKVMKLLKKAKIKAVPTGLAHGTVTAVFPNVSFQITTLRKDVETDGRHAVVQFSNSWVEDAQRRDFTINTLLMDGEGNIYDPIEDGFDDLDIGRIRFVGEPAQRIKEDYLRILRFFRFNATHGRATVNKQALEACVKLKGGLTKLSKERITTEILKLLKGVKAAAMLRLMKEHKILPWLTADFTARNLEASQPLLNLVIVAGYKKARLQKIIENLALSREQVRTLENTLEAYAHLKKHKLADEALFYTAQTYGLDTAQSAAEMLKAKPTQITKLKKYAGKKFPLSGQDLMAAGYKAGPALGKALEKARGIWIKSLGAKTKKQLLSGL